MCDEHTLRPVGDHLFGVQIKLVAYFGIILKACLGQQGTEFFVLVVTLTWLGFGCLCEKVPP